jgi:hypothetical protein
MPAPSVHPMRGKACAACFAFLLLNIDAANAVEQSAPGTVLCAEKETLLATLVEAHGQLPNAASARLVETSVLIVQARAACDDGRVDEAAALYDRVIADVGLPLPAISKVDPSR